MGWHVDPHIRDCCATATAYLRDASNHAALMKQRVRDIEGGTRTAIGIGHSDGDRLLQDLVSSSDCLSRTQSAIQRAVGEIALVNRMVWVGEGES